MPSTTSNYILKGALRFEASTQEHGSVTDEFEVEIEIPEDFPDSVPSVKETGNRIPRTADDHTFTNGALCLGSPLRLKLELGREPSLIGFVDRCVIPSLYARKKGEYVFGELSHGADGLVSDYQDLLGLQGEKAVLDALEILSMSAKQAKCQRCPCGCGQRLSRCAFRKVINRFRRIAKRSWYKARREQLLQLQTSTN